MEHKRARAFAASIAIVMVASFGMPPSPANAVPPGWTFVRSQRSIIATDGYLGGELCVDEKVRVPVAIVLLEEYRDAQGELHVLRRSTGQPEKLKATTIDKYIASATPDRWRQGSRGSIRGRAITIKGEGRGTATVTFSDERNLARPWPPLDFEVHECHYEVSLSGTWHINAGFKPAVHQSVTNLRLDPGSLPDTFSGTATAMNQATAPDYQGCTVTYSVPGTLVTFKATEDANRQDRLRLEITYQPIPDVKPLVCHVPYGVYTGYGAGKVRPLDLRISLRNNVSTTFVPTHVLEAGGEWVGLTRITVKKVVS